MAVALKSRSSLELVASMLLVGAWRHYGWALYEGPARALVYKASWSAATLFLLFLLWRQIGNKWMAPVMLWWAWEEMQCLLCTTWFIFDPWLLEPGQAMCSAKAGFDIGALGILVVAVLAFRLTLPNWVVTDSKSD